MHPAFFFLMMEDEVMVSWWVLESLSSRESSSSKLSSNLCYIFLSRLTVELMGMYLLVSMSSSVWLRLGIEGIAMKLSPKRFNWLIFYTIL